MESSILIEAEGRLYGFQEGGIFVCEGKEDVSVCEGRIRTKLLREGSNGLAEPMGLEQGVDVREVFAVVIGLERREREKEPRLKTSHEAPSS